MGALHNKEYDSYGDPVFDIYEEKILEVLYDAL
jgi:hypothetical protein